MEDAWRDFTSSAVKSKGKAKVSTMKTDFGKYFTGGAITYRGRDKQSRPR